MPIGRSAHLSTKGRPNHYGRPPTLVDAGTGVVIAAEFRKMCLPRNPTTTTPSGSATTITATAAMATRLPRSAASIMPMLGTDAPSGNRLQMLRDQSQAGRVFHVGFGGGDATVASPEFQVPADTLRRTECSCQAALNPGESHAIRSAGPNQDDGRPHSVRVREGTPFAGCEDGLRPTSDGDRGPQCDAGQPAATTSFTEALWHQSCTKPVCIRNDPAETGEGNARP